MKLLCAKPGDRTAECIAMILMTVALVFGGGSRGASDAVVYFLGVVATVLAALRWRPSRSDRLELVLATVMLVAATWAVLSLVPIPVEWWRLPARVELIAALAQSGHPATSLPLTLERWGTVRTLLAMSTFMSFWALVCTLPAGAMERLLRAMIALAVLMALLGFAQAASGERSPLRFHPYHHSIGAIGTFANRNHFASLMAMTIPLVFGLGNAASVNRRGVAAAGWYCLVPVLYLAAVLSLSRTGLVLATVATLISLGLVMTAGGGTKSQRSGSMVICMPIFVAAIAAVGVGEYASDGLLRRLQLDPMEDLRWQYLRHGWAAARAHLPWGSGLGSFRDVYAEFEPAGSMSASYALHAHNEVIELIVETGVVGAAVVVAMVIVVLLIARKSLIDRASGGPILPAVASVSAFVPMLHSLVDYPLRTYAVSHVLAVVLALAVRSEPGTLIVRRSCSSRQSSRPNQSNASR